MILLAAALWLQPDATAPGSLSYQIDCMASDTHHCSAGAYKKLWERLGWSAEDDAALARWNELYQLYRKDVELDGGDELRLGDGFRLAGLQARDWDGYHRSLEMLMRPADARDAWAVVERFRPRFEKWWKAEARKPTERAARAYGELLSRPKVAEVLALAERFYGFDAGLPPASLHVVAHPGGGHYNGTQILNHSVIESSAEREPEDSVDVAAHEMFHYFYRYAPKEKHDALRRDFLSAPDQNAMAVYGLLNESLATALGQGLVSEAVLPAQKYRKQLQTPGGFYSSLDIDLTAKALVVPLRDWTAQGKTLWDPGFARLFLDAARQGLGSFDSLPLHLRNCVTWHAPGLKPARQRLMSTGLGSTVVGMAGDIDGLPEELRAYPLFLFVSEPSQLKAWAASLGTEPTAAIRKQAAQGKPFVYGVKRPQSYAFVFVGRDAESLAPIVEEFLKTKDVFVGVHAR